MKAMGKARDLDVTKGVESMIRAAGGKDISVRQSGVHSNDNGSRLLTGKHVEGDLEHAINWFDSKTSITNASGSGLQFESIQDWEKTVCHLNIFSNYVIYVFSYLSPCIHLRIFLNIFFKAYIYIHVYI